MNTGLNKWPTLYDPLPFLPPKLKKARMSWVMTMGYTPPNPWGSKINPDSTPPPQAILPVWSMDVGRLVHAGIHLLSW